MRYWALYLVTGFLCRNVMSQCSDTTEVVQLELFTPVYIEWSSQGSINEQNMSCSWILNRRNNSNQMLVEVHYKQLGGSIGDYLKVFAGLDDQGASEIDTTAENSIGTRTKQFVVTNSIYVQFVTDDDPTNSDFGIYIHAMESKDTSGAGCGGNVNISAELEEKFITSPLFPSGYPKRTTCTWNILLDDIADIFISLFYIDIEPNPPGCYDSLQFTGMEKICNERTWYIDGHNFTFNDSVTVTFTTDEYTFNRGFVLAYKQLARNFDITSSSYTELSKSSSEATMYSTNASRNTLSRELSTDSRYSSLTEVNTKLKTDTTTPYLTSVNTYPITYRRTDFTTMSPVTNYMRTTSSNFPLTHSSIDTTSMPGIAPTHLHSKATTDAKEISSQTNEQITSIYTSLQREEHTTVFVSSEEAKETSSPMNKQTNKMTTRLQTDIQTTTTTRTTDYLTATKRTHIHMTTSTRITDDRTDLVTSPVGLLTTENMTATTVNTSETATISPAALGGIITLAVVGVASVGILLGVITAMIVNFQLKRTFEKDKIERGIKRRRSQSVTPDWIRMCNSMKTTNASISTVELGSS